MHTDLGKILKKKNLPSISSKKKGLLLRVRICLYKRHIPAGLRIAPILEAISRSDHLIFIWGGGGGGGRGGGGGKSGREYFVRKKNQDSLFPLQKKKKEKKKVATFIYISLPLGANIPLGVNLSCKHICPKGQNLPTWVKYPCSRVGANIFTPRGIFRHVNTMFNLPIGVNFVNMSGMLRWLSWMLQNTCTQWLFCINFICLFTCCLQIYLYLFYHKFMFARCGQ